MSGNLDFRQSIPVRYETDVMVAGGGPAGVAAAVAAAREGSQVVLLEGQNCFGGMGTAGLVPAFMQFSDGVNFMAGGIGREIYDAVREQGTTKSCLLKEGPTKNMAIRAEGLKRIYDELICRSGVVHQLMTQVIQVQTLDQRITHALCAGKSGIFAVKAKVFVDCTGDGDLAAWAGAPFEKGDVDGNLMPGTLCCLYAGLDWATIMEKNAWAQWWIPQGIERGLFSKTDLHLPGFWRVGETLGGGNIGHTFGVDNTDERSTTKALIEGRALLQEYERFYKEVLKGYEKMELVSTASLMGIRETRRIMGDYRLDLKDFQSCSVFADEIGRFTYPVDLHPVRPDRESFEVFEREMKQYHHGPGENYGIPYRCLTPQNLENVLVAGRCISTDRYLQGSVRVMPGCFITGQAAGVAAAMAAATENGTTREISVPALQCKLKSMGGYLPNTTSAGSEDSPKKERP